MLVSLAVAVAGCGGATDRSGERAERKVESLRFSKLVAGREGYCGLTQDEAALVCVDAGAISLERPGPFRDFALHEDLASYRELCTIDQRGELGCDLFGPELPTGPFHAVALGFFNGCALAEGGRPVCWVPEELGGTPNLPIAGAIQLSVDMDRACVVLDQIGHVQCFGGVNDALISELHLVRVSAAAMAACGIKLDVSGEGPGVVCVRDDGLRLELSGTYTSLDTNIDGAGCATDAQGAIRCWGGLQEPRHTEPLHDVTVSTTHVCALDGDGAAHCFAQPVAP